MSSSALEGGLLAWRSVCLAVVALGLTACAQPSTRPIVGPDGQATLFVSCTETGECYELAGRECPNGYDIQPAEGATQAGYLVRCRRAAATAPPTYYDPRSASTAVVPTPAYYAGAPAESTPFLPYAGPTGVAQAPPPPPPPPPPPGPGPEASTLPNQLSMPRPIGSGEPDLGY